MKKLLGILVLGLMLASCSDSETDLEKKTKMIETCADYQFKKRYDEKIFGMSLGTKLKNYGHYQSVFQRCEIYLKTNPITFKEKYLD